MYTYKQKIDVNKFPCLFYQKNEEMLKEKQNHIKTKVISKSRTDFFNVYGVSK